MAEYNHTPENDHFETEGQQFVTESPLMRPGERPLVVFVSSVMAELEKERQEIVRILNNFPPFSAWAFEFTPGSSEPVDSTYLRKVREADIVIWLIGAETTEPVRNEIQEALASNRRLWAVKLPVEDRSQATQALLEKVGSRVKWVDVEKAGGLKQAIELTLQDEIVRAFQGTPEMGYLDKLEELNRRSMARCISRWQAAGVPRAKAEQLAANPSIGAPCQAIQQRYRENKIIVLVGNMGAGKSLIAERLYQQAIVEARKNINGPIPVYLQAFEAVDGLEKAIKKAVNGLGNPSIQGVHVFVDGVDEVETANASRILNEGRILANTWLKSRIVLTSRPIPIFKGIEEAVTVPQLTDEEAYGLIDDLAGKSVSSGMTWGWSKSIQEAIHLPLFAVLMGNYLHAQDMGAPKSKGELISHLVEQALMQRGINLADATGVLHRLAALSIDRSGSPIPAVEVAPTEKLTPLLESGLVVEHSGAIFFPLPILTQWFAARSLAEGFPSVGELLNDPQRLEAWRYPLIIFVATFSHEQVTSILEPLTKEHPGFVSQIIDDGLASWGLEEEVLPPPPQECGQRIRTAMKAWVEGIGPLAQLIAPVRDDGTLLPIGVRSHGAGLITGWYYGTEKVPDIVTLPLNLDKDLRWPHTRWARPGRQSGWAWRWALEELSNKLSELLRHQALPIEDGPLTREYVWITALKIVGRGSLDYRPIPLSEIEKHFSSFPSHINDFMDARRHRWNLGPLRREILRLRNLGELELRPPWPGPDLEPRAGWVWEMYSDEQLLARTKAVYEGALKGYQQLVETWFSRLADQLDTWVILPARLVGNIIPPDRGKEWAGSPKIHWYLEPLPYGTQSYVDLTLGTGDASIKDPLLIFNHLRAQSHKVRPGTMMWGRFTIHHGILDIFEPSIATRLAYDWLWEDLSKISWVNGSRGRREW
ncbi:DUF4062 domain-containing protein [Neomoorella thermoacetica]|uniref:DUF4062 domain-containing protein n=2 Tax=Neomoorella thermoacetica TaxID=1525 RepID=UPI0008FA8F30|nr:hypothetical protein MOOTH_24900 [Moorella thermoacetica]